MRQRAEASGCALPACDVTPARPEATAVAAVISDTHIRQGRRWLPAACLQRLCAAQLIIHAGDISTIAALERLRALGPPVIAVAGNVEEAALAGALPEQAIVRLGGRRIAVVHDAGPARGRLARMRARFPGVDAVIFGHSHMPLYERDAEGFAIFNPGSPTQRRRAPAHTMGQVCLRDGGLAFELITLD
jgi:putative phosphoesterase